MKYYAVTEDPNELLHYGRLGMKWGQHIFVGPKSLAYRNAARKLRSASQKSAVKAPKAKINGRMQRAINRQKRQEAKYNKAVKKAQDRIAITERLYNVDRLTSYENQRAHENKMNAFAAKTEAKRARVAEKMSRKYARNEAKMEKYTQEAREGRLKYGKLSPEQVDRITNRLALERSARVLGNTEKPKFRKRMKEALQEGILEGVKQGTAAGMREIAVDKVQNKLRNKRVLDKANRNEAKRQKEATRIKNKRTHKEIREDLRDEAYAASVAAGAGMFGRRSLTTKGAAKKLMRADELKRLNTSEEQYKLLYDKNGELTKRGKKLQEIEDKKMKLESDKNLRKKLYDAEAYNNSQIGSTGEKLRALEDAQRERKRIQENEDRRKNERDEAWDKHVKENGATLVKDPNSTALIDLRNINKNNADTVYKQREMVLAAQKRLQEESERNAYKKRVNEEKRKLKQEQLDKAVSDSEKQYERDVKKWEADAKEDKDAIAEYDRRVKEEKAKNSWNPNYVPKIAPPKLHNTKKPDHTDYEVDPKSFKYDIPKIESYDERKTLIDLGMPTYFPYEKQQKKGNNGNKGGRRG